MFLCRTRSRKRKTYITVWAFSRQAIALAEQIPVNAIEKYKPEKKFAEAFKALHLYGATVIRPSEMVRLDITTAAETAV